MARALARLGHQAGVEREPVRPAAVGAGRHRRGQPPASTATPTTGPPPLREAAGRPPRPHARRTSPSAAARSACCSSSCCRTPTPATRCSTPGARFEAYPIYTAIVGATEVTTPLRFETVDMAALTKARDRAHPARAGHLAEQPDRHGRPPRRARGPARGGARRRRSSCSTRPTTSTSPASTLRGPWSCCAATRTSPCCARSRRPTGWPRCGSATCSATRRWSTAVDQTLIPFAVNGLGQAAALASLERDDELRRAGRRHAGRAGPGAGAPCATSASRRPTRRPTSCGSRPARRPPRSPSSWRRSASSPARSPTRACGSRSARRTENDQLPRRLRGVRRAARAGRRTGACPPASGPLALQAWVDRIDAVDARLVAHATTPPRRVSPTPTRAAPSSGTPTRCGPTSPRSGRYWLGELRAASSTPPAPSPCLRPGEDRPGPDRRHRPRAAIATSPTTCSRPAGTSHALRAYLAGLSHRGLAPASAATRRSARWTSTRQLRGVPRRPRRAAPRPARRPGRPARTDAGNRPAASAVVDRDERDRRRLPTPTSPRRCWPPPSPSSSTSGPRGAARAAWSAPEVEALAEQLRRARQGS